MLPSAMSDFQYFQGAVPPFKSLDSLIPGGGAVGYKNGIGCKMFLLIHDPVIGLLACRRLPVNIFHFHGRDALNSVDDPAIAYEKDRH